MPHERRIAACTCPVCSSRKAEIRLSAKLLAYIVCNACNFQGFARSEQSDRLLRERAIPDTEATAGQVGKPAPAAAPAAPAPAPGAKPAPAPATKPAAWGAFPWIN